jgi:hypothetical protein
MNSNATLGRFAGLLTGRPERAAATAAATPLLVART